jgi:hypothetical protein
MDVLRSLSLATSLIPEKKEKFTDSESAPAEEEGFFKRNQGKFISFILFAVSFTISWMCNTFNDVSVGLKIFYGIFAGFFGIFYIFYYLIFKRCSILAGTGGPDELRIAYGNRYPAPYGYPPYGYQQPGLTVKF